MSKIYQKNIPFIKNRLKHKNGGFTLIELLVVVLIIGILAAIALPQYDVAVTKSRLATTMAGVRAIADSAERYYMTNSQYPEDDITVLDVSNLSGCRSVGSGQLDCGLIMYDLNSGTSYGGENSVNGVLFNNEGERLVLYKQYLMESNHPRLRRCIIYNNSDLARKVCKSLGATIVVNQGAFDFP